MARLRGRSFSGGTGAEKVLNGGIAPVGQFVNPVVINAPSSSGGRKSVVVGKSRRTPQAESGEARMRSPQCAALLRLPLAC